MYFTPQNHYMCSLFHSKVELPLVIMHYLDIHNALHLN